MLPARGWGIWSTVVLEASWGGSGDGWVPEGVGGVGG